MLNLCDESNRRSDFRKLDFLTRLFVDVDGDNDVGEDGYETENETSP